MKRISLETLLRSKGTLTYTQQHQYIITLLEEGKIKPLKASGTNGKKPALYHEYWLIEKQKDYSELEEELKYHLLPIISVNYYLSHPDIYEQDREWVLMLNDYLQNKKDSLQYQESVNERSFEIWSREKFLKQEQGKRILKRCGLEMGFLNVYGTTEPLAYYSHTRDVPQNLLILENKDTFYSMRRHLIQGESRILGTEIGTLVYGAGKGIFRSFQDFDLCVEPYMKMQENKIYYFGDLDYEGIGIYEMLAESVSKRWEIVPFIPGYEMMLQKGSMFPNLPSTKEQQNRNIKEQFFSYFSDESVGNMKAILEEGKYIPQEILNITDF